MLTRMAITYTSRTGKTYYLHTGPKRGGGTQCYVSTKEDGPLADRLPEGFEIYETVNGQVYLRRQPPKIIQDAELEGLRRRLEKGSSNNRYKVEVQGKILTVHESAPGLGGFQRMAPHLSLGRLEEISAMFAHYQAILRFILVDAEKRLFAPERFCFRGSVDDWISIGEPDTLEKLAAKYLRHLGRDSFYELH
jgi:hypothetical protein